MDIVHFSLHFHWPGGAGRSTENGDRRSDAAITPLAMLVPRNTSLYWNVPCGDTSSGTLIAVCVCVCVCVCVRRHIAILRQE